MVGEAILWLDETPQQGTIWVPAPYTAFTSSFFHAVAWEDDVTAYTDESILSLFSHTLSAGCFSYPIPRRGKFQDNDNTLRKSSAKISSNSTPTPGFGSVTITASNVSGLVKVWNDTLGGTVQFSTAPTVADGMIYIGATDYRIDSETDMLDALDAKTGTKLWSYIVGTSGSLTAPIVANGVVYIGSTNYTKHTSALEALDATSGTKVWSYNIKSGFTVNAFAASLSVANGVVYVGSLNYGKLAALDAKSGTTLNPNDTVVFDMDLSSPGTKQGTVAPYIYALVPVLTVTDANGSHTFTLSSMASIATFIDRKQITCYELLHDQDTTFVPVSTFSSDRSIHCLS